MRNLKLLYTEIEKSYRILTHILKVQIKIDTIA